jgi:hypothetical protein
LKTTVYIWGFVWIITLFGVVMLHKLYSVDICDNFMIDHKVIAEADSLQHSVDKRLKELSMVVDSASVVSDELIKKELQLKQALEIKNHHLDVENTQLSGAINDMVSDVIIRRDTVHITNKK